MANIEVDPGTLNGVYKQKVAQLTDENILLSAAVTQLQNLLDQAERINRALQAGGVPDSADESEEVPQGVTSKQE